MKPEEIKSLKIGTLLYVEMCVEFKTRSDGEGVDRRSMTRVPSPKAGPACWFVGYARKQEGHYAWMAVGGDLYEPPEHTPYFAAEKVHLVARVRFLPNGIERYALPEDCRVVGA